MREMKFRGKDLNGVWRHGSLVNNIFFYADTKKGVPYIFDVEDVDYSCLADLEDGEGFYELRPETVGQFTGLRDKSGKDIYEGDIVQNGDAGFFYVVYWNEEDASFLCKRVGASISISLSVLWPSRLSVIGNIYDNKDLLEVSTKQTEEKDCQSLLPREFRIKAICDNGCDCQKGIEYVACFLTKADGVGKSGKVRIWSCNSWVNNGKRYGSFTDWSRSVLCSYELVPDAVSPEAKRLVGKYFK